MIRIVMFDLGLTLIDEQNKPFDHVPEALAAIAKFKSADKKPLRCCLVSDFKMATPPVTAKKVRPLFAEYLEVLDQTGLRKFFEPVDRRVTLSTHANAFKPDRAVFEMALHRLRVAATLEDCLLITENTDHVKAARTTLRMQTLQFSATGTRPFDFDDWAQAPALVAHLVDPLHTPNVHAAVEVFLAAKGVEGTKIDGDATAGTMTATGNVWHPVPVPGAKPVDAAVPVRGEVSIDSNGAIRTDMSSPSDDDVAEVSDYVGSLAAHGQIATDADPKPSGATHEITVDEGGRRRLVRKRFSAI